MALSILDGNQSATTLSTILSSGQHITAHTVVSLGTQAITDIVNATSANLTNTQLRASAVTVGGTVTVGNFPASQAVTFGAVTGSVSVLNFPASQAVTFSAVSISNFPSTQSVSIASVTVGNTVTIAGTVTANPTGTQTIAGTVTANVTTASLFNALENYSQNWNDSFPVSIKDVPNGTALPTDLVSSNGDSRFVNGALPISGTVTIGAGTANIGVVTIGNIRRAGDNAISQLSTEAGSNYLQTVVMPGTSQIGSVTASISNSVTIASLPAISGTVTANLSISSSAITSGSFTSLTSATLVPANTARKMATVYNLGAGQLFVNAGATATTLGGGFMVALYSGDFYECDYTTTTLSAIFATAGTASWMSH